MYLLRNISRRRENSDTNKSEELGGAKRKPRGKRWGKDEARKEGGAEGKREGERVMLANSVPPCTVFRIPATRGQVVTEWVLKSPPTPPPPPQFVFNAITTFFVPSW